MPSKETLEEFGFVAGVLVLLSIFQWWNQPPAPPKPPGPPPEQVMLVHENGNQGVNENLKFAGGRLYCRLYYKRNNHTCWIELLPKGDVDHQMDVYDNKMYAKITRWKPMSEKTQNFFEGKEENEQLANR